MNSRVRWRDSLAWKYFIVFSIVMALIIVLTSAIQIAAVKIAREATYEKMNTQTGYYLGMLDNEFAHARKVQLNFFSDRNLIYVASPKIQMSEYEKRDALLSVKEHLDSIDGISSMISSITLYLPHSGYVITSAAANRMDEAAQAQMKNYQGLEKGIFYENEDEFFMLENGEARIEITPEGNYLLVVTYAKDKIIKSIEALEDREGGGAFFYSEKYGITEGENTDATVAQDILKQLQCDDTGDYIENQNIVVDGENYLVLIDKSDVIGTFIQFSKEQTVMSPILKLRYYMYAVWFAVMIMALLFVLYTRWMVQKPMERLLLAFERMKHESLDEHISHDRKDEFGYLYDGFNEMSNQINHLVNEVMQQKSLTQKAELKQMQAQINPHFLYNSFFVLSRRVKRKDYEGAEQFAVLLGNYFKFLTRNGSDEIELAQELEHAQCYGEIQATRFRQRIEIEFEAIPERYRTMKVPRLILQPLLENSFEHGLENKTENGLLRMRFEETPEMLFIHIEDNGEELTDERLRMMQESLEANDTEEITGIVNIHRRLQLYFMGNAGLYPKRSTLGGLDISVWFRTGKNQ